MPRAAGQNVIPGRYGGRVSRYRLMASAAQEAVLLGHCAHARYVWNLCVEQQSHWRPGRGRMPGFAGRCRQLSDARADIPWLAGGSVIVQQQAIRDHGQAMGVAVSAALSAGELRHCPGLAAPQQRRLRRLERTLARAERGSERRKRVRRAVARLRARSADIRKDWCEKTSTDIAGRFDVIRVEDLTIANMTRSARATAGEPGRNVRQKAGLNREILRSGWGLLVRRLEDRAPGRVQKVRPAYTSQRCSACGHTAAGSRESQALFRCVACGYTLNADVNAARNIAAGHAVTARGGVRDAGPVNREPQPVLLPAA